MELVRTFKSLRPDGVIYLSGAGHVCLCGMTAFRDKLTQSSELFFAAVEQEFLA